MPAAAQGPPADAAPSAKRLELSTDGVEKRARFMPGDAAEVQQERERVAAQLIETAAFLKQLEARLTTTEGKLAALERREAEVRGDLEGNRGKLTKLMSALQRMGRNPPPVLYTQRTDALQMVRSAILLAAAFPELRKDANSLATKLEELIGVKTAIRDERDRIRSETARLGETRAKVASLMESRRQSRTDQAESLEQVRRATADIEQSVADLNDLITSLDKAVTAGTSLGAYQAEIAKAAIPAVLPNPAPIKPTIVELAPAAVFGSANPGRLKPAMPFQLAKAKLPLPAYGRRVLGFGERTQLGGQSKGMFIETRAGGQVTAPSDGWVVYAGEFRSYGQLLIINAGGGYHVLLAGMSHIDVQPGQFVLAAEPVGTMPGSNNRKAQEGAPPANAPVLYVEFRKDGRPIDPDPWWSEGAKVQG